MLYFVYEFNNNNNTKILCACVIFGLELAAGFVRKWDFVVSRFFNKLFKTTKDYSLTVLNFCFFFSLDCYSMTAVKQKQIKIVVATSTVSNFL